MNKTKSRKRSPEAIRAALIEGENSGEPKPFSASAFKGRMRDARADVLSEVDPDDPRTDPMLAYFARLSPEQRAEMRRSRLEAQLTERAAAKRKRAEGRYTLEEAARQIAEKSGERYEAVLAKLTQAVSAGELTMFEPGSQIPAMYGSGDGRLSLIRPWYEEAFWNDLNRLIEQRWPRVGFRFPDPAQSSTVPVASATPAESLPPTSVPVTSDDVVVRNQRAARAPRLDALQTVILSILDQTPAASAKDVETRLRERQFADATITFTDNAFIECTVRNTTKRTPLSGLKDRVSRARKLRESRESR